MSIDHHLAAERPDRLNRPNSIVGNGWKHLVKTSSSPSMSSSPVVEELTTTKSSAEKQRGLGCGLIYELSRSQVVGEPHSGCHA